MSTTNEEKYVQFMERLQTDPERFEPTLENLRWFIRTGYGFHKQGACALDALNIAYQLQTKHIRTKDPRTHGGTWGDTDEDLQHALKR